MPGATNCGQARLSGNCSFSNSRSYKSADNPSSGLKISRPVPDGPFERMGSYSPDDFQSSMTERDTPSTIAAAFPNNHLTPPEPAAQAFFPSRDLRDEDWYRDDTSLVGNEIDDFARGYNEVARYYQPQQQERGLEYYFETPGFDMPVFAPQHELAGADPGPLDLIPMTTADVAAGANAVGLRRGGSGDSERDRQRERHRLMGDNKDDEGSPDLSTSERGFGNMNVREEGWSPPHLRPSPPRSRERDIQAGPVVQRYELVDEVPRQAVQILHTPGQLRSLRGPRGRNNF
jgi:hypothetical protein